MNSSRIQRLVLLLFLTCPSCPVWSEFTLSEKTPSRPSLADELEVIQTLPHDPRLFTQGMAVEGPRLYQSSGLRGRSRVLMGRPGGQRPDRDYHFPARYFAEGITLVGDEILVLTWQAETLFVLDKHSLQLKRKQRYRGEGWGLTYDGQHLWVSDGSSYISRLNPHSLAPTGSIQVRDEQGAVEKINELEWDGKTLFANVWQTNRLLAIDPASGRVGAEWDLAPLLPAHTNFGREGVANGIAHDPVSGHFWLTGKGWPVLYKVRLRSPWLAKRQ